MGLPWICPKQIHSARALYSGSAFMWPFKVGHGTPQINPELHASLDHFDKFKRLNLQLLIDWKMFRLEINFPPNETAFIIIPHNQYIKGAICPCSYWLQLLVKWMHNYKFRLEGNNSDFLSATKEGQLSKAFLWYASCMSRSGKYFRKQLLPELEH